MFLTGVLAALVLGFLAGLLAFKVKNRWCPACGETTNALEERRQATEAAAK